jgi:hypothetical protein
MLLDVTTYHGLKLPKDLPRTHAGHVTEPQKHVPLLLYAAKMGAGSTSSNRWN